MSKISNFFVTRSSAVLGYSIQRPFPRTKCISKCWVGSNSWGRNRKRIKLFGWTDKCANAVLWKWRYESDKLKTWKKRRQIHFVVRTKGTVVTIINWIKVEKWFNSIFSWTSFLRPNYWNRFVLLWKGIINLRMEWICHWFHDWSINSVSRCDHLNTWCTLTSFIITSISTFIPKI